MKVTLSKNKKELVSKLWSVSETNSKYTSNNIYYLLLLSQENIEISRGLYTSFYSREAIYTFYKQKTENALDNSYLLMLL